MQADDSELARRFLDSVVATFKSQKRLAEKAIGQLADEQLHQPLDDNTNTVAIIMKHMAGNMRSRWTDFLASDGEKPWRHRDNEFVDDVASRDELLGLWENGWACLFDTLSSLSSDDLKKQVLIRGESHTVFEAIHRQMAHYGYHVGQIVLVARVRAKHTWEVLTIPRGGSEAFNREMRERMARHQSANDRKGKNP